MHLTALEFIERLKEHGIPSSAYQMSSRYSIAATECKARNVFAWNRCLFPGCEDWTVKMHKHGITTSASEESQPSLVLLGIWP